jgi:hypothetical protein
MGLLLLYTALDEPISVTPDVAVFTMDAQNPTVVEGDENLLLFERHTRGVSRGVGRGVW